MARVNCKRNQTPRSKPKLCGHEKNQAERTGLIALLKEHVSRRDQRCLGSMPLAQLQKLAGRYGL